MPFTFLFKKKSTFSFLFSKYYLLENYQWWFVFLIQTDIEWKHGGQLWWVSRTVGAVALWSLHPAVVPTRVGGNPSSKQALLMTWKKLRVDILFVNIEYFRMIINQIDIYRWRVIIMVKYKMFIHVLRHIHVYSWIECGVYRYYVDLFVAGEAVLLGLPSTEVDLQALLKVRHDNMSVELYSISWLSLISFTGVFL